MTKLNSKYLKDLIMEVMKVGDFELNVPPSIPDIDASKKFAYVKTKIPSNLELAVLDAFKDSLGTTAIDDLMKISGGKQELDWEDFYAILLDPNTQLRQPALAAMRRVRNDNAKYSKAFDQILDDIMAAQPVRDPEEENPYAAAPADIVSRENKPPPQYVRDIFNSLGLDKFQTLSERLEALSNFSSKVMDGNIKQGDSIRETFSSLAALNSLSKLSRSLEASPAGLVFEDFLALLSQGVAIGEKNTAVDFLSGLLIDKSGNFSQHSSAKLVKDYKAIQSQASFSRDLPGQQRPDSLDDLVGFNKVEYDKAAYEAAKDAFEAGEKNKVIDQLRKAGVPNRLIKQVEPKIPTFRPQNIPVTSKLGIAKKAANTLEFGNEEITYIVGVKTKEWIATRKNTEKGYKKGDVLRRPDSEKFTEIEVHKVTVQRTKGQGFVELSDLKAVEPGVVISFSGTNVVITGLGQQTKIGSFKIADTEKALIQKSDEALSVLDEFIPPLIKAASEFSSKTKSALATGEPDAIDNVTDLYSNLFDLINNVFMGSSAPAGGDVGQTLSPSPFASEVGVAGGVETSGDKVKQVKAKKIP